MASTISSFVTKDMIPAVWYLTEEQEAEWLEHMAGRLPGGSAATLQRVVVIELPDFPIAYAYQEAYAAASAVREDLVMPIITSLEQWRGRREEMANIVRCLLGGIPPVKYIPVCNPHRRCLYRTELFLRGLQTDM